MFDAHYRRSRFGLPGGVMIDAAIVHGLFASYGLFDCRICQSLIRFTQ